jgi:hypothetical protein
VSLSSMIPFSAVRAQAFKTASKDQYMGTHTCQQPPAVLQFLLACLFTKNFQKAQPEREVPMPLQLLTVIVLGLMCGSEMNIAVFGHPTLNQHVRAAPMRTEPAVVTFAPCLPPSGKTPEHHKNCERKENGRRSRRLPATHVVANCQQHDRCKPNGCPYAEPRSDPGRHG